MDKYPWILADTNIFKSEKNKFNKKYCNFKIQKKM